jgi:hypothetical protein
MSNYSRYKSRHTHSINSSWLEILIPLAIALLILFGYNACTANEWNGGKCPDCNVRYELRGVYRGTHYYACPDCGNEVSRYGGK